MSLSIDKNVRYGILNEYLFGDIMLLEQLFQVKTNSCKMYAGISLYDNRIQVSPLLSDFTGKSGSIYGQFIGVFEVAPGGLVISGKKLKFSQKWMHHALPQETQCTMKYMTIIPQVGSLCFFE